MALATGASGSRAFGRCELVIEVSKSKLGPLWAAATHSEDNDTRPLLLRRVSGLDDALADQVERAAKIVADVRHPRLAQPVEVFRVDGELGVASEYIAGETLRALLRLSSFKHRPVPVRVAVRITLDALEALAACHEAFASYPFSSFGGLSPDSILVGTDGHAYLLDAGLAGVAVRAPAIANHADLAGYAAPEQLSDEPLDARADLFSIGVLFWEMLTGRRLFVGATYEAVIEKVRTLAVPRLDNTRPAGGEPIPQVVADIVARMVERQPDARFASVSEAIAALQHSRLAAEPALVASFVEEFAGSSVRARTTALARSGGAQTARVSGIPRASAAPIVRPSPAQRAPSRAAVAAPPPPPVAQARAGRSLPPPPPRRGGTAPPPPSARPGPPTPPPPSALPLPTAPPPTMAATAPATTGGQEPNVDRPRSVPPPPPRRSAPPAPNVPPVATSAPAERSTLPGPAGTSPAGTGAVPNVAAPSQTAQSPQAPPAAIATTAAMAAVQSAVPAGLVVSEPEPATAAAPLPPQPFPITPSAANATAALQDGAVPPPPAALLQQFGDDAPPAAASPSAVTAAEEPTSENADAPVADEGRERLRTQVLGTPVAVAGSTPPASTEAAEAAFAAESTASHVVPTTRPGASFVARGKLAYASLERKYGRRNLLVAAGTALGLLVVVLLVAALSGGDEEPSASVPEDKATAASADTGKAEATAQPAAAPAEDPAPAAEAPVKPSEEPAATEKPEEKPAAVVAAAPPPAAKVAAKPAATPATKKATAKSTAKATASATKRTTTQSKTTTSKSKTTSTGPRKFTPKGI